MHGRVAQDRAVQGVTVTRDSRVAGEHGVATFELMLVALIGVLVLAIAMPALLRTSPAANDTDARANLANAIDSAKASYFVGQSYSWKGAALSPLSFDSQDPAFSWTTGSCAGQSPVCVSEQVVDVHSPGDGQGVVIAVWSSATRTCWYAADLESVPRLLPEDRSGVPFDPRPTIVGPKPAGGVYYAKSEAGASSCRARSAVGSSDVTRWSPNPSEAGFIG
jgi:type II secretory pathway pseudopilin PulG